MTLAGHLHVVDDGLEGNVHDNVQDLAKYITVIVVNLGGIIWSKETQL